MSIQIEYYLSCNKCDCVYEPRSDDAQALEDEAIDDGWEVLQDNGDDGRGCIQSTHICDKCINTD
jgi:hypothetical protein